MLLSDEQQAFVEAMRDFAARECGTREQREAHEEGHDPEIYRRIAELGWVGVSIPERYGGGGGSVVDLCLLLEETTRGLLPAWRRLSQEVAGSPATRMARPRSSCASSRPRARVVHLRVRVRAAA